MYTIYLALSQAIISAKVLGLVFKFYFPGDTLK